jgi:hypothetical protein
VAGSGEVAFHHTAKPSSDSSRSPSLENPKTSLFYLRSSFGLCCGMFDGHLSTPQYASLVTFLVCRRMQERGSCSKLDSGARHFKVCD